MSEALERAARLKTKSELLADKIRKLTEQQKAFENEITELELSDVKQSVNKNGIEIEDAPTAIEIYSVGKKCGLISLSDVYGYQALKNRQFVWHSTE